MAARPRNEVTSSQSLNDEGLHCHLPRVGGPCDTSMGRILSVGGRMKRRRPSASYRSGSRRRPRSSVFFDHCEESAGCGAGRDVERHRVVVVGPGGTSSGLLFNDRVERQEVRPGRATGPPGRTSSGPAASWWGRAGRRAVPCSTTEWNARKCGRAAPPGHRAAPPGHRTDFERRRAACGRAAPPGHRAGRRAASRRRGAAGPRLRAMPPPPGRARGRRGRD